MKVVRIVLGVFLLVGMSGLSQAGATEFTTADADPLSCLATPQDTADLSAPAALDPRTQAEAPNFPICERIVCFYDSDCGYPCYAAFCAWPGYCVER